MANLKVVLTRPQGENESLAELIDAEVLIRPLINLSAIPVDDHIKKIALGLDHYDKIIFVSKPAVRFGMEILDRYWPQWPAALGWLAVGPGTAAELDRYGIKASYPEQPGSEGLLELPELGDVRGEKVLIVRGRTGREMLGDALKKSGADVAYLEIYARTEIKYDDWAEHLSGDATQVVVLTSGEIAEHFVRQAGEVAGRCIAIVPSARVAELADASSFRKVINAGGASDQALYDAVLSVNVDDSRE